MTVGNARVAADISEDEHGDDVIYVGSVDLPVGGYWMSVREAQCLLRALRLLLRQQEVQID